MKDVVLEYNILYYNNNIFLVSLRCLSVQFCWLFVDGRFHLREVMLNGVYIMLQMWSEMILYKCTNEY